MHGIGIKLIQISYIKELKYEKSAKNVKEFEKMSLYIRRLYRYMIMMYESIEIQSHNDTFAQLKNDKVFVELGSHIIKCLTNVAEDINKRQRISYKQIISFEKHIVPLLKDKYDNEVFLFSIKMFFTSFREAFYRV